jgi:ParB family chromosome partitioning protein
MSVQQAAVHREEEAVPLVAIESIIPNPRQPRRAFREDDAKLLELSESIKEHGLIQPIVVARLDQLEIASAAQNNADSWFGADEPASSSGSPDGAAIQYQIIAGERRWRAARLAGLPKVPVLIKEVTPQQMLELALIENIQRADLNPIEEALAYQSLIQEFGLTQEMVAKRVGKDRSTISNSLRLLQLAARVRDALITQPGNFTEGHARTLIGIESEEHQVLAMQKIISQSLNVRQAEELARNIKDAQENQTGLEQAIAEPPRRHSHELDDLEASFRNALMVKVDLKCNAKGKGTLVLHFDDQEQLERLYGLLVKHEG